MTAGEAALSREDLRALIRDLCTLSSDRDQVREFLHDAGVSEAGVRFDDRTWILWTSALQHAHQQGRVPALLQQVQLIYPNLAAVTTALQHPWNQRVSRMLEDLLAASRSAPDAYTLIRLPLLDLPDDPPPSAYLKAQHAVVPFAGREARLQHLLEWCLSPAAFALNVLTGAGGMGKTRLLMELCERLEDEHHWTAGFIGQEDVRIRLQQHGEGLWLGFTHQHQATLLVLDYAESRLDQVRGLRRAVYERDRGPHPLRVVLLAREAGGWWEQLGEDFAVLKRSVQPEALESLLDLSANTEQSIQTSRMQEYQRAQKVFAQQTKPTQPVPEDTPDLSELHFERVLMVHTLALLSLEGFHPGRDPNGTHLLDELLGRERSYWRKNLERRGFGETGRAVTVLQQAMTLVTLGRPAGTQEQGTGVLQLVPQARKYETDPQLAFLSVLHETYPSPKGFIDVMQPDVFGEHVVFVSLTSKTSQEDPSKLSEDGKALIAAALDEEGANPEVALTVLARLAARRPQEGEALLEEILEPRLEQLAQVVVRVILAGGTGVLKPVERLMVRAPTGDAVRAVVTAIPQQTQTLAEFAVNATQLLVNWAREEVKPVLLAQYLNNLSIRLSELGRRDEALRAIQEAVNLRRELARIHPNAFTPDLAGSLTNLGNQLGDLGRREEALPASQEAVKLYRELARVHADVFKPNLAKSLNNLSIRLRELGQPEEALSATQEAVDLRRELARAHSNAYTPDLASSLNNLSVVLGELGRRAEALQATREAIDLYRELAHVYPDIFTPDLAQSLITLSNRLGELGRREESLYAIQEAVDLRR